MRLSILTLLLTATAMTPAFAQMNTLTVTNDSREEVIMENSKAAPIPSGGYVVRDNRKKADTPDNAPSATPDAKKEGAQKEPGKTATDNLKPLPAPKLTAAKNLKQWEGERKLFTARGNTDRINRVLSDFESEPGRLSPAGLFEVAELYREHDDMKQAARYYYAAQLRARFDALRWPGTSASDANSYFAMSQTAATMGNTIGAWATAKSERLSDALNDAREWDAATPYDYHPGYELPTGDKVPKEDAWPKLLETTRDQFFREAMGIASALKALGQ